MALVSGAAVFKKKIGLLTIFENQTPPVLQWRAADEGTMVEINLHRINRPQATPDTSEKMVIKLTVKQDEGANDVDYFFQFNSRLIMDNVKESLQQIVARHRTSLQAAAQETAKANEKPLINLTHFDEALLDEQLLKNHELQQKLLMDDKELMATFREAVMNQKLDSKEFWKTRMLMLRAFALSNSQKRGPFNVLSTIKPTATADNQVKVSVTREQILAIFEQYPVVRKAFDDNVPRLSEGEFWSRFFSSKLFRKLRGEKIATNLRGDVILDKYINVDIDYQKNEDETSKHTVNKSIGVDGNDITKKGDSGSRLKSSSVLKSMNRLSQKMMNSLGMEYSSDREPVDQNMRENRELERMRNELVLTDLEEPHKAEFAEIHLNGIKERHEGSVLTSAPDDSTHQRELTFQPKRHIELSEVYSDAKKPKIDEASQAILNAVRSTSKSSMQSWQLDPSTIQYQPAAQLQGVETEMDHELLEKLRLTHGAASEFLRHFWLNFNSGDPSHAATVRELYKSLVKSKANLEQAVKDVDEENSKSLARAYLEPLRKSIVMAMAKYQQEVTREADRNQLLQV